ncbi:MAG TPA: hypothetical protein VNL77_06195 [Roseiflexaceae bacterium]|nr:hypothetical protein [Roseiflexaceae bacterium]
MIGLGLLLAVLIAAAVRGAVRDAVVAPLLLLLWGASLLLGSLPQALLWGLLVLLAAVLAVRSLSGLRVPALRRRTVPGPAGRTAAWLRLVQLTGRDEYARWRLAQRLAQLAVELLAEREGLPPQQARRRLEDPSLDAPPAVRAYLRAGLVAYQPRPGSQGRILRGGPLDVDLERVVHWLEGLL